jgi:hypothetical protein
VTSWGSSGIDAALGGGIPIGTLVALVEDAPTAHHDAFIRIFLAQGLAHGHALALAQQHTPPSSTFASLPAARTRSGFVGSTSLASQPNLNIAWRYAVASGETDKIAETNEHVSLYRHAFDLSETYNVTADAPISFLGFGVSTCLDALLCDIRAHIRTAVNRRLMSRIVVRGLTSAFWTENKLRIDSFVHRLRVLAQRWEAVVVVSVPRPAVTDDLCREADIVMSLDTFGGLGAGVAGLGTEWLGVMAVEKPFRAYGSLKPSRVQTDGWVFKRGRRKYVLEPASAAPDLDEINEEEQSSNRGASSASAGKSTGSVGCGFSGPSGNALEF